MCAISKFSLQLAFFFLLACFHQSYQEENLSKVATQMEDNQSLVNKIFSRSKEEDEIMLEKCSELMLSRSHDEIHSDDKDPPPPLASKNYRMWLSASFSIIIISLCGVFGVMVVPMMQKVFYQHLIQFLVALAIGSMLGDAFLHLIPHAFSTRSHGSHGHDHKNQGTSSHVWIGFFGLIALILFFLTEKSINMIGEWRERRREMNRVRKVRIVLTGHKASNRAVGERICKHKYSAYCVSDIDGVARESLSPLDENEVGLQRPEAKGCIDAANPSQCENESRENIRNLPSISLPEKSGTEQTEDLVPTGINSNPYEKSCKSLVQDGSSSERSDCQEWWGPDAGVSGSTKSSQYDTVFIQEHEHSHHGHSHAHSHLHSAPDSIGSVAWMVIVGDGIHNLADGLAVGAAFTEDFMSGLSTSIAVLCHELPHEVGDFAMLLKAGMSVRQAVFYNILSSFLAFLGMIIGVLLGNVQQFTPWIFMGTAGIFMYIALVDMMPELSSGHTHPYTSHEQHEARSLDLASQVLGLATGILIMLLIALFEHDLRDIFISFTD